MDQPDLTSVLPLLKKIPIFAELSEEEDKEIIEKITLVYFPKDTEILKQGEVGDAMYIIKEGSVMVYLEPSEPGEPIEEIAILGKNDFFGEMALVSDNPRTASIRAMEECELFVLKKADFDVLIAKDPNLANKISTKFIHRFKETVVKRGK